MTFTPFSAELWLFERGLCALPQPRQRADLRDAESLLCDEGKSALASREASKCGNSTGNATLSIASLDGL
jgi:hypothetical protein